VTEEESFSSKTREGEKKRKKFKVQIRRAREGRNRYVGKEGVAPLLRKRKKRPCVGEDVFERNNIMGGLRLLRRKEGMAPPSPRRGKK